MSKSIGKIPNRTITSLGIDKKKLELAKKRKINISLLLDAALSRELMIPDKQAFAHAIEKQNKFLRDYIENRDLKDDLDKYTYGEEDVLEEEETKRPTREDRGYKRSVRNI